MVLLLTTVSIYIIEMPKAAGQRDSLYVTPPTPMQAGLSAYRCEVDITFAYAASFVSFNNQQPHLSIPAAHHLPVVSCAMNAYMFCSMKALYMRPHVSWGFSASP